MPKKIPDNLLLGFASSAYQIEGAWDEYGKGESNWDRFTHSHPDKIRDRSNGDIACDFFHKFKEDVQLIKNIGGQIYRFSLSWARILPKGFSNEINTNGINYYNNLIDELIKNKIEPMVTLYHWDLPQTLQDLGGWPNPVLADYFCDYADVAFKHFGDRVKKWVTFNEPETDCSLSYGVGCFAPGICLPGIADYMAGHTILKAHAKAYHLYDKNYRLTQRGEIGISVSMAWREPRTSSPKDLEAANEFIQLNVGWLTHPIFSEKGDYPELMKKKIAEESKNEGFTRSRLPELDQYWINYIRGTSDFFGLNHYTTALVSHRDSPNPPDEKLVVQPYLKDVKSISSVSPDWVRGNNWLCIVPWGFRKCLKWVKETYRNPKIYVTENGFLDKGTLDDNHRIFYYHHYIEEMLNAINEDGCRIGVYTAWSLTDNFEWSSGYTERFGIYHVDFQDPGRKKTPKKSVQYIKNIYKNRALPDNLKEYEMEQ